MVQYLSDLLQEFGSVIRLPKQVNIFGRGEIGVSGNGTVSGRQENGETGGEFVESGDYGTTAHLWHDDVEQGQLDFL
jgi:hypothetical protein